VCRFSAVSRDQSLGNCFPQLGAHLFVIAAEALTSRPRSIFLAKPIKTLPPKKIQCLKIDGGVEKKSQAKDKRVKYMY
jgi:hypothetical protein